MTTIFKNIFNQNGSTEGALINQSTNFVRLTNTIKLVIESKIHVRDSTQFGI